MNSHNKQVFIRQKATESRKNPHSMKDMWSRHAVAALVDEGLRRKDVEEALCDAEVIEDYPVAHRPLPDCLVLSWLANEVPVHVVVAVDVDKDRIFIVTVYVPTHERWKNDWRTRK